MGSGSCAERNSMDRQSTALRALLPGEPKVRMSISHKPSLCMVRCTSHQASHRLTLSAHAVQA